MAKFDDVRSRVFTFALNIIKMCNTFPKTESNRVIIRQILRSATSIGANLEEAAGAHTRAEFLHCLNISKKEARETDYWLRLSFESNNIVVKNNMKHLLIESLEITKILTASVKNTSMNSRQVKSS